MQRPSSSISSPSWWRSDAECCCTPDRSVRPSRQVIQASLPGGCLLHLHVEDALLYPCFRDALYRDLHADGRWPLLALEGKFRKARRGWRGSARRRVPHLAPGAYVMLGSGAWARRTVLKYPMVSLLGAPYPSA